MIRAKTLFVVGAGASADFGFPLGTALTKQIANALNLESSGASAEKELLRVAIEVANGHPALPRSGDLFFSAREMHGALVTASSIDTFLDNRSKNADYALLGKMAIACCLIEAERRSPLRASNPRGSFDLSSVDGSWIARLFDIMAAGVKEDAVDEMFRNVSFLVFNYDRCIEHYFQHALASRFGLGLEQAAKIVRNSCRIIHPYGTLGSLGGGEFPIPFGLKLTEAVHGTGDLLHRMSQNLLTFSESQKTESIPIREAVAKAARIVFIGFGFHEQNVDLLRVPVSDVTEVRATAFRLSPSNQQQALLRIRNICASRAIGTLENLYGDLKCDEFIEAERFFLSS
ncbi:MAG: hypothetical protein LCH95_01925 [Proteobacteria bacterium]|nr:hypothetical protein [Pseudomonadota bacterium]